MRQFKLQKTKIHSFIKYIVALCISIIVGLLMLIAVYMLPVKNMKTNVARSSEIFNYEGLFPQLVSGYKYMQLDNYTESIMLGAAIYDGKGGVINKAIYNEHPISHSLSEELALTNYANEVSDYEYSGVRYARYWHGYLVPVKLLLLFFDYADIRIFNFFLQNLLLFFLLKLFYKTRMEQYIPAFLVTVFVINPLTAGMSLVLSTVYYITLLSAIYLLWSAWKGKAGETKINFLFFIAGVLTAYFDFLTYPLVPCGVLNVLYLIINRDNIKMASVKALIQKILLWCFGYGGMWSGKWLIGSILTKSNMFADALHQIAFRISLGGAVDTGHSRLGAVVNNVKVFMKWPFLLIFLIWGGVCVWRLRKLTHNMSSKNVPMMVFLILTAAMPIVWMIVASGHSYHYWFASKELAISCFALLSLSIYLKNLIAGNQ